jgi:transcriptional regulator with XRE-family HTH domain
MNRIKELREKKKIGQKVLASDLGVSQPTVCAWENGTKVPSSKSTAKLADYFGVSMDYLLGREYEASSDVAFGERLKQIRREKDMTQDENAKALRVSTDHISDFEKGITKPQNTFPIKVQETESAYLHELGHMFSLRLRELREKTGYSQNSLADAFGVPQSTIENWETGKREPNYATLQRLAEFFCVSVDYLLGRNPLNEADIAGRTAEDKGRNQFIKNKIFKTMPKKCKTTRREYCVSVHFSEDELERIWALSKEYKVSPAECVRQLTLTGKIKSPQTAKLVEDLLSEVRDQGNNLNQIAEIANKSGNKNAHIDEMLRLNKEISELLEDLL